MLRKILPFLWLLLAPCIALAQSTATPVVPGYLSTTGCSYGQTTCFVQFGAGNGNGQSYKLLTNASATGAPVSNIVGASYVYSCVGTFGGASLQLQALGPDGSTYLNVGTAQTANGSQGVVLGNSATAKVVVTGGTPSGLNCSLS